MGLSAGLSTTVPDPVGDDGLSPSIPDYNPVIEGWIDRIGEVLDARWTFPWPVLHISLSDELDEGASYEVEIGIDILSETSLDKFVIYHPSVESIESAELEGAVDDAYDSYTGGPVPHIELIKWNIVGLLIIAEYLTAAPVVLPPLIYQAALILLAAASLLFLVYIYSIYEAVSQGYMDSGAAMTTLFEMMIFTFGIGAISSYSQRSSFLKAFWHKRGLLNYGTWVKWGARFHLWNVVIKVVMFVTCLVMFLFYTGMWLELY